jgi:hypothetical protein
MAQRENTGLRDETPNIWHRKLGRQIYMTDIDCLETHYENHKIIFDAIIDWKCGSGNSTKSLKYAAMQMQLQLAEKLQVPMFVEIDFLRDEFPVKMYFLRAANKMAEQLLGTKGMWFSPRQYSHFQHKLRGLLWNEQDFDHLPNEVRKYKLPEFDETFDNLK